MKSEREKEKNCGNANQIFWTSRKGNDEKREWLMHKKRKKTIYKKYRKRRTCKTRRKVWKECKKKKEATEENKEMQQRNAMRKSMKKK